MKTKMQFIEELKDMTNGMSEIRQNFLVKVFKEMMGTIKPFFAVDGREYYGNFLIENLVTVDNGVVTFTGFHNPNGRKIVKVNFTEDNAFVSEYELDMKDELGNFSKNILRFPMSYDNQSYNLLVYKGNLPRATRYVSKDQIATMIDINVFDGIENGRPVQLYRSGSYKTIGKYEDIFTYGVWNIAEDGKNLDFTPFIGKEDESISFEDGKEILNFLYTGNVPKDNILKYDISALKETKESEKQ